MRVFALSRSTWDSTAFWGVWTSLADAQLAAQRRDHELYARDEELRPVLETHANFRADDLPPPPPRLLAWREGASEPVAYGPGAQRLWVAQGYGHDYDWLIIEYELQGEGDHGDAQGTDERAGLGDDPA